ncbi:YraN family protein [Butyrivibrio sp. AE3004]|uniref:YraN family protein n=1 Tax=Butyrivibrio sp. AE3004 TaxID=1506994 RepID=UPI000493FCA9|nr:YraN family protein [Butyrivibrio sp. AE3004]
MNKRETGTYYENLACEYIMENGAEILLRNFRSKKGEIDIVAKDGRYLIFIEVKYRTTSRYGTAEAAVNYRKQKVICRVSDYYMKRFGIDVGTPVRYDVIAIWVDEMSAAHIRWHKNAFSYIPCKAW